MNGSRKFNNRHDMGYYSAVKTKKPWHLWHVNKPEEEDKSCMITLMCRNFFQKKKKKKKKKLHLEKQRVEKWFLDVAPGWGDRERLEKGCKFVLFKRKKKGWLRSRDLMCNLVTTASNSVLILDICWKSRTCMFSPK